MEVTYMTAFGWLMLGIAINFVIVGYIAYTSDMTPPK